MSFQKPPTPIFTKSWYRVPHHARAGAQVRIREDAVPRPDVPDVDGAVRIVDEMIARGPFVEWLVASLGRLGDVQIGDEDHLEALPPQIGDHLLESSENARAIDRERSIVLLVVDVEVDDVRGDLLVAKRPRQLVYARLRVVRVTRLLEAERPDRREGRLAGQVGVAREDGLRLRTGDEVVVEVTAVGAERAIRVA